MAIVPPGIEVGSNGISVTVPKSEDLEPAKARWPIHKYCGCGTLIWDVPAARFMPRSSETIICWKCGADHTEAARQARIVLGGQHGKETLQVR